MLYYFYSIVNFTNMSIIDFDLIDIPIEFKKINPSDFDSNFYESKITQISPNNEGYISEALSPILHDEFKISNTVVINAGVGQGKSRAIMDKVIDYSKSDEYIVIIAVPFYSLIKQYEDDCLKRGVKQSEIFNIEKIKKYNFLNTQGFNDTLLTNDNSKISDFKIHIMTINSLLGNPGENNISQSGTRTKYFDELKFFCSQNNKKIVVVFDEIHDGIQNFKEEFIYSLWSFQELIFKIFIISATFNEASKEVIKYLSEFTKGKISIIEAKRIRKQKRQSKLNLIFNDYKAISNNSHLKKLTKKLIEEKKKFDVIIYSKKQIKLLLKPNGLLYSIKDEINLCYKDIFDFSKKSDKRYDENLVNVGTNFTTGVNIEKEDPTLIIILPKRLPKNKNINRGIFSSGINALIQTLARQRNVGEIYIVMPTPYKIQEESLPYNQLDKEKILKYFEEYAFGNEVKYSNINTQRELLKRVYDKKLRLNNSATIKINNTDRSGMNTLDFPSFERFSLENGEKYLTNIFFDGDLASYTFFASITNQFLNCTLNEIFNDNKILIEEGKLLETAYDIYFDFGFSTIFGNFDDEMDEANHTYYSEYYIIKNIMSFLENKEIYFKDINENEERANPSVLKELKRALLYLCIYHGNKDKYESLHEIKPIELGKSLSKIYFQSCVNFSKIELFKIKNDYYTKTESNDDYLLTNDSVNLIIHYKKWTEYINLIENKIQIHKKNMILSKEPSIEFKRKFKTEKMIDDLHNIITLDLIINEEIISFKDTFLNTDKSKVVETFYTLLFNTFFTKDMTDIQVTIAGSKVRFHKNPKKINISSFKTNLLYNRIPEFIL